MDDRGFTSLELTTMKVCLPKPTTQQTFVVVECLSAPAILGCDDFLMSHGMIIDLRRAPSAAESPCPLKVG